VELCFRELKASYALDKFRTENPEVVEALIWSALLTLTAARRLHALSDSARPSSFGPATRNSASLSTFGERRATSSPPSSHTWASEGPRRRIDGR